MTHDRSIVWRLVPLFWLGALLALFSACGSRQPPVVTPPIERGTVHGVTLDADGQPVADVLVTEVETGRVANHGGRSDGNGYWAFFGVTGDAHFRFERDGWDTTTRQLPIWEEQHRVHLARDALPEPPPSTLTRLRVEENRRWFANEAGRFDWREISAFSLLSRLLRGEADHVRHYLRTVRGYGFTVARVLLTLDGDYWREFRSAPDMAGYWERLDELVRIAGEEGIYLRLVMIGAIEPFGGVWHPDRRDVWTGDVQQRGEAFILEVAARYAASPVVIYEFANEPLQIGLRDSFDTLIAMGPRVKAVAPHVLLTAGAADGASDNRTDFAVQPFDFIDAHIERRMAVGGMEWVKRSGEYAPIDQEAVSKRMPFVSGEPVNFGESRRDGHNGDVERSPSVAFAYAGVSRARQYNTTFHYDGGLWTTLPTDETLRHIRAYHTALDAFPMMTCGTKWRGHWAESYFQQVWPPTDDVRQVEQHIADGRGPWRVYGCDGYSVSIAEPKGWNWSANTRHPGVRRLAESTDGVFNAAVYGRFP